MKYREFKDGVKRFEEEFGLPEVLYLEAIKKLEGIRKNPHKLTKELARGVIGSFLATWGRMGRNVERKEFKWEGLAENVGDLKESFDGLRCEKLQSVDLDDEKIKNMIEKIYEGVRVKNLGPTGISKVMHLLNPELFVMWDEKIREKIKAGKKFSDNSKHYIEFLKWIQKEMDEAMENHTVSGLRMEIGGEYIDKKTLAKLADEYCFAKIQGMVRRKRQTK